MMPARQIDRTIGKFKTLETLLEDKLFIAKDKVEMQMHRTFEKLHKPPSSEYYPAVNGETWGSHKEYCWFRGEFTVPAGLAEKQLFLCPLVGFREALFFVNSIPSGIFTRKPTYHDLGKHAYGLIADNAIADESITIEIEAYAGHDFDGTQPFKTEPRIDFNYVIDDFLICVKDELVFDAYFNIRMLNELVATVRDEFRKAELINCLIEAHNVIYYAQDFVEEELYRKGLQEANEIIKVCILKPNGGEMPSVAIIGHSHMDTAWLWEIDETIKKCARTFSNAISMLEQYDEYLFIQSSSYHGEMMRRHYPALFEKIKKAVASGRYEPNGGAWVECDCNITSGEFMIRQFLWGQSFTSEHFGYTSNVFWLPDTFGYSRALPQIMKGCGIDYFLTTKMDWNDTTPFPYDTFNWQGLDGTSVFSHLNRMQTSPAPIHINSTLYGTPEQRGVAQKGVTNTRLLAFGIGDGGGGPGFDMIEMARRSHDTKGLPKAYYSTVGEFMQKLEREAVRPNTYAGELYLEFHRGTLTSIAKIKRNNRKAELGIRDAELAIVREAFMNGLPASDERIKPYVETTLINQFHDLLPGSSITEVNERSYAEMDEVIERVTEVARSCFNAVCKTQNAELGDDFVTAFNTLSFKRNTVTLPCRAGKTIADAKAQTYKDIDGNELIKISDAELPSMGSKVFRYINGDVDSPSAFMYSANKLETPFAHIEFDEKGYISSFIDKRNSRQIRGDGYSLNTFLFAEDTPLEYESWDIDLDYEMKLADTSTLLSREVVSDGSVEFRIRSRYSISDRSFITQDMVFHADRPQVDFETKIEWHDKHRLLKAAFDTNVFANFARQEIQFGYAERPTTRNNEIEMAKFETLNHKYSDLSELNYGVSILNDCKYGISIHGGSMRLTLLKGGTKPDPVGSEGINYMTYSLLPHIGGFSAVNVTRPAYELNCPPIVVEGSAELPAFAEIDVPNIMLETVKPCHVTEKAFIARLYECEGNRVFANVAFNLDTVKIEETNMLEEPIREIAVDEMRCLEFRPFEIKTLKVWY